MAMVTEMRIPGGEHGERFNYRGMHRYLVTFLRARDTRSLADKSIVLRLIPALHDACREHHFDVYAYTFLPDRLVLIIRGREEGSDMRAWVRTFRVAADGAAGAEFGIPVFARRYTERVLRKTEVSGAIAEGVFHMAVAAGLAKTPAEYEFQGSFVLADSTPRQERHDVPRRSFGGPRRSDRPSWKDRSQGQRSDQRKSYRSSGPGDRRSEPRREFRSGRPGERPGGPRKDFRSGRPGERPSGPRKDFRSGRPGGRPGGPRKDFRSGRPGERPGGSRTDFRSGGSGERPTGPRKDFRRDQQGDRREDQRKDFRSGGPGDRRTDQRRDFRKGKPGDRRNDQRRDFRKGPRKPPRGKP